MSTVVMHAVTSVDGDIAEAHVLFFDDVTAARRRAGDGTRCVARTRR